MLHRRLVLALVTGFSLAAIFPAVAQEERLKVVASFSILGDIVGEVSGDRVEVTSLVGTDGDAHVYEPTPADARKLGEARILFENGLAFEGWLPRIVKASGFRGARAVVSEGVTPRQFGGGQEHEHEHEHDEEHEPGHDDHHGHAGHDHGPDDPHAWQNVANAVIYAKNIAAALEKIDPDHAPGYRERAAAYVSKLEALDAQLKARFDAIPRDRRRVITSHDAFGYFGEAYGIDFLAAEGVSTESEASAADVARIIDQIKKDDITAIFVENIASAKLTEQIASSTGASIGGRLYSDALSGPAGPAATYIGLIESNANLLIEALTAKP